MKKEILDVQFMPYSKSDIQKWDNGDYSIIPHIITPLDKMMVQRKASKREGRYFGECMVLRKYSNQFSRGRYTHSFHWLYNDSWYKGNPKGQLQQEVNFDLEDYFPISKLRRTQLKARKYITIKHTKPSSPDIWLIATYPNSWFIEVKKLNEECKPGQLEGMAIITKYLNTKVSIFRVYQKEEYLGNKAPKSIWTEHDKQKFKEIYRSLDALDK